MERLFFGLGSLLGGLGVILGAFGAHGLKGKLTPEMLAVFETGVRYQLVHALALLAAGLAAGRWPSGAVTAAGWLFLVGTLVFSGSIYGLALGGPRWLGPITPLGGTALIVGWFALAAGVLRSGG